MGFSASGDLFCEGFDAAGSVRRETCREVQMHGISVLFGEADSAHVRSGKYATVICGKLWEAHGVSRFAEAAAEALSDIISGAACAAPKKILVCALGNSAVTADSLGDVAAGRVLAGSIRSRQVFVIKAGVPSHTGIASGDVVSMFTSHTKAELVICVDSLAAITSERLGSVIQITDCGISPGSGVSSHAEAISKKTVGIPVVSIGIPTVIRGDGGVLYTCAMADELIRRGSAVIAGAINGYISK